MLVSASISTTCNFYLYTKRSGKSDLGVSSSSSYFTSFDRTQTQCCSAHSVNKLSKRRLKTLETRETCTERVQDKKLSRRISTVLISELFASFLRATAYVPAEEVFESTATFPLLDDEHSQTSKSKSTASLKRVRYKGSSWSITLPENFQRDQQKKCRMNCQNQTGVQQNLELIQFRDDHEAEIAIYAREANSFKLSLFQLSDIKEFGKPKSAANILLPIGYRLNHYSERIENCANDERVYYTWDITFSDQRILVTVSISLRYLQRLNIFCRQLCSSARCTFLEPQLQFKLGMIEGLSSKISQTVSKLGLNEICLY